MFLHPFVICHGSKTAVFWGEADCGICYRPVFLSLSLLHLQEIVVGDLNFPACSHSKHSRPLELQGAGRLHTAGSFIRPGAVY